MSKKLTVLLVDDDNDLLIQYTRTIRRKFTVKTATSGVEAVEIIEKKKPALIVMDVIMDNITDGLDTAKKLKADGLLGDTPIIMLSSVDEHYDYRAQIPDDYFPRNKWLHKPVKPSQLLLEIEQFLG